MTPSSDDAAQLSRLLEPIDSFLGKALAELAGVRGGEDAWDKVWTAWVLLIDERPDVAASLADALKHLDTALRGAAIVSGAIPPVGLARRLLTSVPEPTEGGDA